MGKKRVFTKEFKRRAVRLVVEEGRSASSVARSLGVSPTAVCQWKRQLEAEEALDLSDDEREELLRLRKENEQLREEREILKKAAAFFAKEKE